jgi:hypothetical protein
VVAQADAARPPQVTPSVRGTKNWRTMNKRVRDRRGDQGSMDDLATQRVMRHLKQRVDRAVQSKTAPHPKRGCMVCYANDLEKSLKRNQALPRRRSDRSLIGDLGDLHARVTRIGARLDRLLARPGSKAAKEPFEVRLLSVASDIKALGRIARDVRGPMGRLIKQRCGNLGLAAVELFGAAALIRGREDVE